VHLVGFVCMVLLASSICMRGHGLCHPVVLPVGWVDVLTIILLLLLLHGSGIA
jgi:hypothetical protein